VSVKANQSWCQPNPSSYVITLTRFNRRSAKIAFDFARILYLKYLQFHVHFSSIISTKIAAVL